MSNMTTPQRSRQRREAGLSGWAPYMSASTHDREEDEWWRRREIEMIERALGERGVLQRRELGKLVGCRYWGPGRFRRALQAALDQDRIQRVGFGRYALSDRALEENAS